MNIIPCMHIYPIVYKIKFIRIYTSAKNVVCALCVPAHRAHRAHGGRNSWSWRVAKSDIVQGDQEIWRTSGRTELYYNVVHSILHLYNFLNSILHSTALWTQHYILQTLGPQHYILQRCKLSTTFYNVVNSALHFYNVVNLTEYHIRRTACCIPSHAQFMQFDGILYSPQLELALYTHLILRFRTYPIPQPPFLQPPFSQSPLSPLSQPISASETPSKIVCEIDSLIWWLLARYSSQMCLRDVAVTDQDLQRDWP